MTDEEFSQAVAALRDKMYARAYPILQNPADAEDAVSSAVLLAYEHRAQLSDAEKLAPWILTITRNEALKLRQKQMLLPGDEAVEALLGGWQDSYSELWDVIQSLPKDQRDTVILFYYNDLSIREIAEISDVKEGTVKSRLNRARSEIRQKLSPQGTAKKAPARRVLLGLIVVLAAGILLFGLVLPTAAHWNIFDFFKLRLLDFLGGDSEVTVETVEDSAVSTPMLTVELKERLVNRDSIYLLVLVTLPPELHVEEDMGFSYFAFFDGDTADSGSLLGGALDCRLFETDPDVPNAATYVITLSGDLEDTAGEHITLFLENFARNPMKSDEEVLVTDSWHLTFSPVYTETEDLTLSLHLKIPYLEGEYRAKVQELTLTPLGLTLLTDISEAPKDLIYVSDSTIAVTLLTTDGERLYVSPYDETKAMITSSGGSEFTEEEGGSFQRDIYQFTDPLDISRIVGAYIQDVYVPFYEE